MIEKNYDSADTFLIVLKACSDAYSKDDPINLKFGFVSNDIWHKLPLKYCKGRKDVADALKVLKKP